MKPLATIAFLLSCFGLLAADINITNVTKSATVPAGSFALGQTGLVTRLLPMDLYPQLGASQTFTGSNNFTGGLAVNGVPVSTNAIVQASNILVGASGGQLPVGGLFDVTTNGEPGYLLSSSGGSRHRSFDAGNLTNVQAAAVVGMLSTPNAGYSNRMIVDINTANCGYMPTQRLELKFNSTQINLAAANADGRDITCFDSDGKTQLPFYLKAITTTNVTLCVLVTNLAGTGTKSICVDYGNAGIGASLGNLTNVITHLPAITNGTAGRWLMNEGSGTVANDTSGHGSSVLYLTNNCTWTTTGGPGPNGTNAGLNGPYITIPSNGYALTTNGALDTFGAGMTMRMWVRFHNLAAGSVQWLFNKAYVNTTYDISVLMISSKFNIRFNGDNLAASSLTPVTNHWYHIVAVWGVTGRHLYIDGALVAVNTTPVGLGNPGFANQHAMSLGGAAEFGFGTPNTIDIDVGPLQVDWAEWEIDDVLSDFKWLGRPVPIGERQKWVRTGPFTNSSPGSVIVLEPTRLLSSFDGRWKVFSTAANGTSLSLAESDNRDFGYVTHGNVLGSGTPNYGGNVSRSFEIDDGQGKIYAFWLNSANDLYYSSSVDGGHTFSAVTTQSTSGLFLGSSASAGHQGNVSITAFYDGPLAGQYGLVADMWNTGNDQVWAWSGLSTNITGPFTIMNGGYSMASNLVYGVNLRWVKTIGAFTRATYFNGRYHCFALSGIGSTPNLLCHVSTPDWSNWTMDEPASFDLQDQNWALDQIADPDVDVTGGNISLIYSMMDNTYGVAGNPQRLAFSNVGAANFNGTISQLFTKGSVRLSTR